MVAEAEFRVSSKFSSSAFLPRSGHQTSQNNATATRVSRASIRFVSSFVFYLNPIYTQDLFSCFPPCVLHPSAHHTIPSSAIPSTFLHPHGNRLTAASPCDFQSTPSGCKAWQTEFPPQPSCRILFHSRLLQAQI